MKAELHLIPTLIVNPSNIVIYNQVLWEPCKPSRKERTDFTESAREREEKFLKSTRKSEGNVSVNAKRKITKALDYLIATAYEKKVYDQLSGKNVTFKVAFVTLTLPSRQVHSDIEIIEKCLNSLLIEIKKYYNVSNYVWRAEKQKNGNVHFHLIIDKFISWSELRDRWNRIINKLGYVDRYRNFLKEWHSSGFKVRKDLLKNWDEQAQRLAYTKGKTNDFNNPNSTDIHSTKKIRNITKYLTKYLTKNETHENQPTTDKSEFAKCTGRIWGCNRELSNITGYQSEIDNETSEELEKIIRSGRAYSFKSTYFTVLYIDWHTLKTVEANWLFGYFSNYLLETFNYSEQLKLAS